MDNSGQGLETTAVSKQQRRSWLAECFLTHRRKALVKRTPK